MTFGEMKEKAIENFIKAWDELTMLGLMVCDDATKKYIDKDDIDVREMEG